MQPQKPPARFSRPADGGGREGGHTKVCVCVYCTEEEKERDGKKYTHTTHTHTHEKFFKMKQKKTGENSVVVQRAFQVVCEAVGTFCKLRRVSAVARARAHAHTHTHTHLPQVRTGPLVRAPFPFATGN